MSKTKSNSHLTVAVKHHLNGWITRQNFIFKTNRYDLDIDSSKYAHANLFSIVNYKNLNTVLFLSTPNKDTANFKIFLIKLISWEWIFKLWFLCVFHNYFSLKGTLWSNKTLLVSFCGEVMGQKVKACKQILSVSQLYTPWAALWKLLWCGQGYVSVHSLYVWTLAMEGSKNQFGLTGLVWGI